MYPVLSCSFRRGGPSRHEGRGPRGRDGFPGPEDFGPDDAFDSPDENSRGRDHGARGRGRGALRGKGNALPHRRKGEGGKASLGQMTLF